MLRQSDDVFSVEVPLAQALPLLWAAHFNLELATLDNAVLHEHHSAVIWLSSRQLDLGGLGDLQLLPGTLSPESGPGPEVASPPTAG